MLASYHGFRTDASTIRRRFAVSTRGLTLTDLIKIAQRIGLSSRAVRLEVDDLYKLSVPCILHWNLDHFVVLKSVGKRYVIIHDPAFGEKRVSKSQLDQSFTGVALETWPAKEFQKGDERASVSLFDVTGKIKGLPVYFAKLLCLGAALEVINIALPLFSQWTIDNVISTGNVDLLILIIAGTTVVLVLNLILTTVQSWFVLYTSSIFGLQWKAEILSHLVRLPMDWFQKRHLGDITSRFNAADTILSTVNTMFVEALIDGIMAFITLGLMFLYNPMLAGIAVAAMAVYILFRLTVVGPYRTAIEERILAGARESSHLMETIKGVRTVKLSSRESERRAEWVNVAVEELNAGIRLQRMKLGFRAINTLLAGVERILIFWLGMKAVLDHQMTLGAITAFIAYKDQFYDRVSGLVNNTVELRVLRAYVLRLSEIVLTPTEDSRSDPNCIQLPSDRSIKLPSERIGKISGSIQYVNVSFRYGDYEPYILRGLSLHIRDGESVAIVGPSGCGKTTLVNIVLGLVKPSEGQVLVGGISIEALGVDTLRRNIGAVMQDDLMFSGSIAENISSFDALTDMDRIIACAKTSCIHKEIMAMPMGYNTILGELGNSLSGGQKQRVHIARALYKQPRVLVMDEATSHLDVDTEKKVSAKIKRMGLTRIIVAHRPETISSADRVIHLDNGKSIALGPGAVASQEESEALDQPLAS
jgi:ATP-binding cassette subfamily B protein RaxB